MFWSTERLRSDRVHLHVTTADEERAIAEELEPGWEETVDAVVFAAGESLLSALHPAFAVTFAAVRVAQAGLARDAGTGVPPGARENDATLCIEVERTNHVGADGARFDATVQELRPEEPMAFTRIAIVRDGRLLVAGPRERGALWVGRRGQATVELVGLALVVALLLVGLGVAAVRSGAATAVVGAVARVLGSAERWRGRRNAAAAPGRDVRRRPRGGAVGGRGVLAGGRACAAGRGGRAGAGRAGARGARGGGGAAARAGLVRAGDPPRRRRARAAA